MSREVNLGQIVPNIQVGATRTITPTESANVINVGTSLNPIFDFYIPKGDPGAINLLIVNELPLVGSEDTLYFVPKTDTEESDLYDEYVWINNDWELVGTKQITVDLSDYYTKQEVDNLIPTQLSELSSDSTHRLVTDNEKSTWNGKQDKINDLETIRSGAASGKTAVQFNDLATVATSGSYNDLSNKPTIPTKLSQLSSDVTHRVVTDSEKTTWNSKYDKPSSGIPKTDLASGVQTSLEKADTALQSISSSDVTTALGYTPYNSTNPNGYTSNTGTITGVKMNGRTVASSGVANLGTVITEHQDISGKQDLLVSGTNIKTINNQSILGSGNITIEGGGSGTVDTAMSDSSTNAVQNRVIKSYVDDAVSDIDLSDYVKNTDYASSSVGGVIKTSSSYGSSVASNGTLQGSVRQYSSYSSDNDKSIICKGTLENVITGKDLTTKAYVDDTIEANNIDVQINESSIVSDNIANISVTGSYNETDSPLLSLRDVTIDGSVPLGADEKSININTTSGNYDGASVLLVTNNTLESDYVPITADVTIKGTIYSSSMNNAGQQIDFGIMNNDTGNSNSIVLTPTETYIGNVKDPENDGDAVNKKYVDNLVGDIESILTTLDVGGGV